MPYRTIRDTLDAYSRAERAAGRSPHTIRLRCSFLRRWGAVDTVPTIDGIRVFLGDHNDWSPQTRASAACAIRSWLRWAQRVEAFPDLPRIGDIDVPPIPRRRPRPLREAVIVAALATCDESVALMILMGREAGMRRAEIARCHSDDLAGGLLLVHGKGGRQRVVPISPMLADHIARRPSGWMFPNPVHAGAPMTPAMVGSRVRRALGGHGTTHQLRHSFATSCYAASGHDIRAVQELLGHSSVATTMNYVGLADDALRSCVRAGSMGRRHDESDTCSGPVGPLV